MPNQADEDEVLLLAQEILEACRGHANGHVADALIVCVAEVCLRSGNVNSARNYMQAAFARTIGHLGGMTQNRSDTCIVVH